MVLLVLKTHYADEMIKFEFQNTFHHSLTCNRESCTRAIDTVHPAGRVEDHITLGTSLAPCLATPSSSLSDLFRQRLLGLSGTLGIMNI